MLISIFFQSSDVVMGQQCSSVSDCSELCEIGYPTCIRGMCNCCVGWGPGCHRVDHANSHRVSDHKKGKPKKALTSVAK